MAPINKTSHRSNRGIVLCLTWIQVKKLGLTENQLVCKRSFYKIQNNNQNTLQICSRSVPYVFWSVTCSFAHDFFDVLRFQSQLVYLDEVLPCQLRFSSYSCNVQIKSHTRISRFNPDSLGSELSTWLYPSYNVNFYTKELGFLQATKLLYILNYMTETSKSNINLSNTKLFHCKLDFFCVYT